MARIKYEHHTWLLISLCKNLLLPLLQLFSKVIGAYALAISVKFVIIVQTYDYHNVGRLVSLLGCRLRLTDKKISFSKDDSLSLSIPLYPEKCEVPWRQKGEVHEWNYG